MSEGTDKPELRVVEKDGADAPAKKSPLKSLSFWGVAITALGGLPALLAQLLTENQEVAQVACFSVLPAPWSAVCAPLIGLLVALAGVLMTVYGVSRKPKADDIKGAWGK